MDQAITEYETIFYHQNDDRLEQGSSSPMNDSPLSPTPHQLGSPTLAQQATAHGPTHTVVEIDNDDHYVERAARMRKNSSRDGT